MRTVEKEFIGKATEAPAFSFHNRFILSGYRINFKSAKSLFKSIFMLHNESVNIWSHLLGALFFIILALHPFDIEVITNGKVP